MLVQQDNSVLCGLNCESQLKLLRVQPKPEYQPRCNCQCRFWLCV
jgi:hypothetical protein